MAILEIDSDHNNRDLSKTNKRESLDLGASTMEFQLPELPPELLFEIFSFATSGENAVTPFLLGKICHEWRGLVFDSCPLWQTIDLKLEYDRDVQFSLLEGWINRAGSLPLSVTITYPKPEKRRHLGHAKQMEPILAIPSTQVSSLSMNDVPHDFFGALAAQSKVGPWPILSYLHVSSTEGDEYPDEDDPVFGEMPALRSVSINYLYVLSVPLPWSQLLHIYLGWIYPYEICGVLGRATNLLSLDVSAVYEEPNSTPPTETHQTLRRLTFSNQTSKEYSLFKSLRLPELGSLELRLTQPDHLTGEDRGPLRVFDIYPFLSESGCRLVELSIDDGALAEPRLLLWLSILPTLRTLRLSNNKWYDEDNPEGAFLPLGPDIFRKMAATPSHNPILPFLENLTFEGSQVSFSPDLVMNLLHSRWGDDGAPKEGGDVSLRSVVCKAIGPTWTHLNEEQKLIVGKWKGRRFRVDIQ
ncbi:hypothetical protein DFP72DRAFT_905983 [Ephemerocybe angulata]|uniref:F-box domain-containing protein n=1 Tax=Ephemerocybe angulata TaxID=980116 RepID=A0A8H6HTF0_9AGAR|nr:hypothetical protein DFP72DRAFT_905983 [Tulosesus angulatus]